MGHDIGVGTAAVHGGLPGPAVLVAAAFQKESRWSDRTAVAVEDAVALAVVAAAVLMTLLSRAEEVLMSGKVSESAASEAVVAESGSKLASPPRVTGVPVLGSAPSDRPGAIGHLASAVLVVVPPAANSVRE